LFKNIWNFLDYETIYKKLKVIALVLW